MGYQNSTAGTALTEAYLDEEAKQALLNYATAAARNADGALSTACREGIVSYQVDENTLKVQRDATLANISTIGPVHGAWIAWTPAVVQSVSVTATNTSSAYMRVGRLITFRAYVTVTGSGTASNIVTVTLPVAAALSVGPIIGNMAIYDTSAATLYAGLLIPTTTTTVGGYSAGGAAALALGVGGFTAGLAVNDTVGVFGTYEAAADA